MCQVSLSRLFGKPVGDPDHLNVFSRPSSLDVQFVDFDNVRFHLSTPDRKTQLLLSMNIRCWDELAQYGAVDVLRREYGSLYLATPEPDYHVSLSIDLEQVPPEGGACSVGTSMHVTLNFSHLSETRDAFINSIALLKRNALAAPFEQAFREQKQLESSGSNQGQLMQMHYRDEEAIYVRASADRVTVIFSTVFQEETDRIFGKVFLQACARFANMISSRHWTASRKQTLNPYYLGIR